MVWQGRGLSVVEWSVEGEAPPTEWSNARGWWWAWGGERYMVRGGEKGERGDPAGHTVKGSRLGGGMVGAREYARMGVDRRCTCSLRPA